MSMPRHKPWRVCFLPELVKPSNEHSYEHFNQVKGFVDSHLKAWKDWATRYSTAGLVVLDELRIAVADLDNFFYSNPHETERVLEALLDPHTSTFIRVRVRKVKP